MIGTPRAAASPRRGLHVLALTALLAGLVGELLLTPARPVAAAGATTTSALNLRVGFRFTSRVKLVMPAGAAVEVLNRSQNGFWKVVYQGVRGYAHGDYLDFGGGGGGGGDAGVSDGGATGTAAVTSALNLRAGPSTGDRVLLVLPAGATVALTGQASNGFLGVRYQGTSGWAFGAYLGDANPGSDDGGGAQDPGSGNAGSAWTTSALNLRSGPSTSTRVLLVLASGAEVTLTGSSAGGFLGVVYNGTSGWASGDYLRTSGTSGGGDGSIIWPVESGGAWSIIQGYNAGTHSGSTYRYSLDLQRSGGGTAGTNIYAPVSGTVLWNDPGSGGIAIDLGNGYALCLFHVTFSGDVARGDWVSQGQWLGSISGPGGPGYAATPHVDMTLWFTGGGGRISTAFTGEFTISGYDFPESGVWNAYGDTVVYP